MNDPDIVTWLRSILHNDRSVELRCKEAADEIERLRAERDEARRQILEGMHPDLRQGYVAAMQWDCY
jgi:hypothetical protein